MRFSNRTLPRRGMFTLWKPEESSCDPQGVRFRPQTPSWTLSLANEVIIVIIKFVIIATSQLSPRTSSTGMASARIWSLVAFFALLSCVSAFYLPGVAPRTFRKDQQVNIKVPESPMPSLPAPGFSLGWIQIFYLLQVPCPQYLV